MNSSTALDAFHEAFIKNLTSAALGLIINYINGTLVFTFFQNVIFYSNPRYILYIHLIINDMIMLSFAVGLQITTYVLRYFRLPFCCILILFLSVTNKNTPLTLAGMAVERYIAICKPLHHSQICTVRRTHIVIGLIWCFSIAPSVSDIFIALAIQPIDFFSSVILCHSNAIYSTQVHKRKQLIEQVLHLSFVWLTLVTTYFKVVFAAKAATADPVSARKAQNTILLHGVQLLLCMLTYISPLMNTLLLYLFPQLRTTVLFISFLLFHIFPRLLNPLIYGLRDQTFMKYVKIYMLCRLRHVVRPDPIKTSN